MSNLRVTIPAVGGGNQVVTTKNHATGQVIEAGVASIQLPLVNTWYPVDVIWTGAGKQTSQNVVLPITADIKWSLTGGVDAGVTSLDIGVVKSNVATRFYVKATSQRAVDNLNQTVSNIVYGTEVNSPTPPVIVSLSNTSVAQTSAVFNYLVSDVNTEDIVVVSYCVVARGDTPVTWTIASGSPLTVTSLVADTDYDFYLKAYDGVTTAVVSNAIQFRTSAATAVNPTFTTNPQLKTGTATSQGFTTEYGINNPSGNTLTHEISYDNGATWATVTPTTSGGLFNVAVTGKTQSTAYQVKVRVSVTVSSSTYTTPDIAAVSISTIALTLSGSLTATAGDGQITLDWADATGGANGYDVEYGIGAYDTFITDPTVSNAILYSLTNGQLYQIRVRAHDSAGNVTGYITTTQTPSVNTAPAGTYTFRIDTEADDANTVNTPAYFLAGDTNWQVGKFDGSNLGYGGCGLFRNVQVGRGQTISTASLKPTLKGIAIGGVANSTISAQNVGNASMPTDYSSFSAAYAQKTTQSVTWNIDLSTWTVNTQKTSPDIKTIIQAIVNHPDWTYGSNILIFWGDFAKTTTAGLLAAYTGGHATPEYHMTLSITVA